MGQATPDASYIGYLNSHRLLFMTVRAPFAFTQALHPRFSFSVGEVGILRACGCEGPWRHL